jgi:two-component system cell cycle sensor histidine kinase/response regulator CckA
MSNKTILVVDDESGQRELMHGILCPEAYSVLEAADYNEAIAVQRRHFGEIELALIDLSLPDRNGYELSKALLALEPHLKVLFISGQAGAEQCRFFEPATEVHFLQKPIQPAVLLWCVKSILGTAPPAAQTQGA